MRGRKAESPTRPELAAGGVRYKRSFGHCFSHIWTKEVRALYGQRCAKMTSVFLERLGPSMTPRAFSRGQMVREATLTEADLAEVDKCRRDHNRLGFAYQGRE